MHEYPKPADASRADHGQHAASLPTPPQLVIVSGMSGSGKSLALKIFEDVGYYCTDNLPAQLLPELVASLAGTPDTDKLAVGIDVRSQSTHLDDLPQWLSQVGAQGLDPFLLFMDANDDVLMKRFSDTRRRHPLSRYGLSLNDAIVLERQAIKPLRQLADTILDTSSLNVHQLRREIIQQMGLAESSTPLLLFQSFAFRHGLPPNADFVFDARVLPNPHWNPELRPLSGRDTAVREFLDKEPDVRQYLGQVTEFLDTWLARLRGETRSYITIGIGCSGGRHRSVYLAEQLGKHFGEHGWDEVAVQHRELD